LEHYFQGQQVYVSGDLLVYYEEGNPKKFVVPDAFVVKGVPPGERRVFKTWVERRSPDVAIETTSRKTKKKDTVTKPELFAKLGIQEYFLFDPTQDYLDPPLQGYRIGDGVYSRIDVAVDGTLLSEELGLRLRFEKGQLEFYRIDTGERLLTAAERAAKEAEGRAAAEAELARLRAELQRRESQS
jgi:Uma2 family endonuclease